MECGAPKRRCFTATERPLHSGRQVADRDKPAALFYPDYSLSRVNHAGSQPPSSNVEVYRFQQKMEHGRSVRVSRHIDRADEASALRFMDGRGRNWRGDPRSPRVFVFHPAG